MPNRLAKLGKQELELSKGTVLLMVRYDPYNPDRPNNRTTRAILRMPDGTTIQSSTTCSDEEQFSRFWGRKYAAERMLSAMRSVNSEDEVVFTPEDRRIVFMAMCPEYDG